MGPLNTQPGIDARNNPGVWVDFVLGQLPVFVPQTCWVGFDFDGTISSNHAQVHGPPPYPLGQPIPNMIATVKSLLAAGVTVKIFTARANDPESILPIQDWTEQHGLGRLAVTDKKDYNLLRFFDDRAIPMVEVPVLA